MEEKQTSSELLGDLDKSSVGITAQWMKKVREQYGPYQSKNAHRFQANPWYDKPKGEFVADPHYNRKGKWEPYDLVKILL